MPWVAGGKAISRPVSRRDLRLWLREAYPVLLVVYDGRRERAYWLSVQDYLSQRPAAELFGGGEWVNVRIPAGRRFDRGAVRRIARRKNELHHRFERKARGDVSPPH